MKTLHYILYYWFPAKSGTIKQVLSSSSSAALLKNPPFIVLEVHQENLRIQGQCVLILVLSVFPLSMTHHHQYHNFQVNCLKHVFCLIKGNNYLVLT